MAQRNAQRLLRLVGTLLDFSQLEAGRLRARYRPTDLAALTGEVASMFGSAAQIAGSEAGRRRAATVRTGVGRPGDVGEDRLQPRGRETVGVGPLRAEEHRTAGVPAAKR